MAIHFPGVLTFQQADEEYTPQLPLIFDSPHSGTEYPDDFDALVPVHLLRRFEDAYVDELYSDVVQLGASFLKAHFPRSYIDPNRSEDDIDVTMIEGKWPFPASPTDKSRLGHGLVWKSCPGEKMMYDRKLGVLEMCRRIEKYWQPYHHYLESEIERLYTQFGHVWHVDCHSMPENSSPVMPGLINRGRRADIVLGDRNGTSCAQEFTYLLRDWFQDRGYAVRINNPYRGAELVRRYGNPRYDRHSIQIEINRAIYMDEKTSKKLPQFDAIKSDLNEIVSNITRYVEEISYQAAAE